MTTARVRLWGRDIAAVTWDDTSELAVFQYDPEFADQGVEVSPLVMPLAPFPYSFPAVPRDTFRGLPGLLADSLPDKFGNAVIDAWLAAQSRSASSFNPVERLCYIGQRGMGALEFEPATKQPAGPAGPLDIEALVKLASLVLSDRAGLEGSLSGDDDGPEIRSILRVGTSAGGARAKAVLAWDPESGDFRSGQVEPGAQGSPPRFEPWIMKFDGVDGNRDKEVQDPRGFGRIEYAYHLMAVAAGISMSECRLHHEGGRSHFMTKRFDRTESGAKVHMQSLGAIAHLDFNQAGAHSYEQAIQIMKRLGLPLSELTQQFRRAVFNIIARNQDDHVKNIAFLMDQGGRWSLSPAFDVVYAYNPKGAWTSRHQMSLNGKREGFDEGDLVAFGAYVGLKAAKARAVVDQVSKCVSRWREFAGGAGVSAYDTARIAGALRPSL